MHEHVKENGFWKVGVYLQTSSLGGRWEYRQTDSTLWDQFHAVSQGYNPNCILVDAQLFVEETKKKRNEIHDY